MRSQNARRIYAALFFLAHCSSAAVAPASPPNATPLARAVTPYSIQAPVGTTSAESATAIAPAKTPGTFTPFANAVQNAIPGGPVEALFGRSYLEIEPKFGYRLEYEDNIDFDTSDKLRDFSNHYVPEIRFAASNPRFSLESNAQIDITEYINERQYNCVDQAYISSLSYQPTQRLDVSLNADYVVTSNINRLDEDDTGAIVLDDYFTRYKDKTTNYAGKVTYDISARTKIKLSGFLTQFDTLTTDGSDFFGLGARYSYSAAPTTDLLLTAGWFSYDFSYKLKVDPEDIEEDDLDFSPSLDYTLKNYNVSAGFEHRFDDDDSKLTVTVGYRKTDAEFSLSFVDEGGVKKTDKQKGQGDGWSAQFDLRRRASSFLFGLQGSHDINVDSRGRSYESTRGALTTTYGITQRLSAQVRLLVQRQYADEDSEEFTGARETYSYYVGSSLSYKLYRWLDVTLAHYYRYIDDKRNGITRNANMVSVGLQVVPLRPKVLR